MPRPLRVLPLLAAITTFALPASAAEAAARIEPGDVAWMLLCTALVMLMTIPGLALFYAGMVRKKNVLATMMQSFSLCAVGTVLWMVAGYSLAFGTGDAWIGDTSRLMLHGIAETWDKPFTLGAGTEYAVPTTIPESVFLLFQMAFAIITPAVVTGAFADRMKFSAMLVFLSLWSLLVYAPLAHWVWAPNGWLAVMGVADFAGGTVVEVNAGVTGLVCALVMGRRLGYRQENMAPWNLALAVVGASLLWVGWFGFNAGGALAAGGRAAMAVLATQLAAAGATLSWSFAEWLLRGKPSVLGAISGAVAGLVAVTPAAGFVLPGPALGLGLVAGAVCFWAATELKQRLGYDDSLDVFGVHGVAGIIGMLATGWFACGALTATAEHPEGLYVGGVSLLGVQALAVGVTILFSGAASWLLLVVTERLVGLRVTREEEREGLDLTLHGEQVF
ncbi:Ammonium transporter [Rhodovastum atsumiense]|nr:ammonium transporter [Rhodovastum atsumiense]CAH2604819.1 Ammonium transporter [Rhodovastum atsumiense]